ncbi:MAG TPA: nuclease-related domain-containing protein [Verrucomicrobiae bacterium]
MYVYHDLKTDCGNIDHLAIRKDGAVFLIETKSHFGKIIKQNGELRRNGKSFEKNFISQTHKNIFWLKDLLKTRLGYEPWIHAVIVFSNGHVEPHLKIKGVAVINVSFLSEWMRRQPGNAKAAATLWPEVENLKNELSSFAPNRLARQPALN